MSAVPQSPAANDPDSQETQEWLDALAAGRVRALAHGRQAVAGALAQFPPRGRWQGRFVLSAPVADAGVLAVPDRVDGPRPDPGDLHGALPQVSRGARPRADGEPQGLGVLRRWRDGRARVAGPDRPRFTREAR